MAVAHSEEGAGYMDGDEKCGAGHQLLVVKIAGVHTGWAAADAPGLRRRGHAQAAEERPQRDLNPLAEVPHHALLIEPDYSCAPAIEILGQKATLRDETAVTVGNGQLDFLDAH